MRKFIKIIPKKAGLLIIVLIIQQVSLVFSYSGENIELITEKNIVHDLPLFVQVEKNGLNTYDLNPYFQDDVERAIVLNAQIPDKIMTDGLRSAQFLAYFINKNNPAINLQSALDLADIYIEESQIEGVNHDIAFAQMCLETGFLKFNGSVNKDQNNFCGLGATGPTEKGDRFQTVRIGIRAHIQHLKAYADYNKLNANLVDTRFQFIKRGSATTVDELTGKWAEDMAYGEKINRLVKNLYSL